LDSLPFDEAKEQELHSKKKEIESKIREFRRQLDTIPANLHFAYSAPEGFDKSKVKGLLGKEKRQKKKRERKIK